MIWFSSNNKIHINSKHIFVFYVQKYKFTLYSYNGIYGFLIIHIIVIKRIIYLKSF